MNHWLEGKPPHFMIIGPGGSGVTTALDIFADFGFLTVANVDAAHLHQTLAPLMQGEAPVAFSLRVTPALDPTAAAQAVTAFREALPLLKVLAVDAPADVLVQRYIHSEKAHAFENSRNPGLQLAVNADKKLYGPLKDLKDYSIDTSTTTPAELRHKIARVLGLPIENTDFTVYINTFGFKYGAPQDAELMFDMRFLTNPFYDESLRALTGQDQPVKDFIFNLDHAARFFEKWSELVAEMLPLYQAQGKTRLNIAVGCTGGKHRSVCMGEALADYLQHQSPGCQVVVTHREMQKWGVSAAPKTSVCGVGEASST